MENNVNRGEVSQKELVVHSLYLEKLIEKEQLLKVHEILPETRYVMEEWKRVNSSMKKHMMNSFLMIVQAYLAVSNDDVDELEPFLVEVIFHESSTPEKVSRSLNYLVKICHESVESTLDSINAYHAFQKQSKVSRLKDVVKFFNILFENIQKKNLFSLGPSKVISECLQYVFTPQNDVMDTSLDEDEQNDEPGFSLKDVLENIFSFDNDELRYNAIKLLISISFLSEIYASKLFPVLEKELYYGTHSMQTFVLGCIMDIFFMYPSLISTKKKSNDNDDEVNNMRKLKHFFNSNEILNIKTMVMGYCRLLLNDRMTEYEDMLHVLGAKYVGNNTDAMIQEIILSFFRKYHMNKTKHQEELGNSVVQIVIDHVGEQMNEEMNDDGEEKTPLSVEMAKDVAMEINFLLTGVQSRFFPTIVESVSSNLDKVLDLDVDVDIVRDWLSLKYSS